MATKTLNIAKSFSKFPAGRYISDGPFSGQTFRENHLLQPLREGTSLIIELDGTEGYGSSFLEAAFGGLIREEGFSKTQLEKLLVFVTQFSTTEKEIWEFIEEAENAVHS